MTDWKSKYGIQQPTLIKPTQPIEEEPKDWRTKYGISTPLAKLGRPTFAEAARGAVIPTLKETGKFVVDIWKGAGQYFLDMGKDALTIAKTFSPRAPYLVAKALIKKEPLPTAKDIFAPIIERVEKTWTEAAPLGQLMSELANAIDPVNYQPVTAEEIAKTSSPLKYVGGGGIMALRVLFLTRVAQMLAEPVPKKVPLKVEKPKPIIEVTPEGVAKPTMKGGIWTKWEGRITPKMDGYKQLIGKIGKPVKPDLPVVQYFSLPDRPDTILRAIFQPDGRWAPGQPPYGTFTVEAFQMSDNALVAGIKKLFGLKPDIKTIKTTPVEITPTKPSIPTEAVSVTPSPTVKPVPPVPTLVVPTPAVKPASVVPEVISPKVRPPKIKYSKWTKERVKDFMEYPEEDLQKMMTVQEFNEYLGDKKVYERELEWKTMQPKVIEAHKIAKEKMLISEKGKPTLQYRRLAKGLIGVKSTKEMTPEELDFFIDALKSLELRPGRLLPRIPITKQFITQEFADKLIGGELKEIGVVEEIRPARQVFEKMGLLKEVFEPAFDAEIALYEDLMKFRGRIQEMQKMVGKTKEVSQKLFREIENPGTQELTSQEQEVVRWGKKFFDKWAEELKLPPEKIKKHYITHIFEEDISRILKDKHPLDPDLIRAFEFITPKRIFNPFLQVRLGMKVGLKENFWAALEAYESRQLKVYHYDPLIKRIRVYEKFLLPNSAKYLREFITRITSRPLTIDREINQSLKEFANTIKDLPGGKKLGELLTKGNSSGLLTYNFTGFLYEAWLGLRPASAIKNLGQHTLILAEVGPKAFSKGLRFSLTLEGKELLKFSKVLRSRKLGYLPGVDETFLKGLESKRRAITMAMFKVADKKNVSDAFLAGYFEAEALGLPREWAIKRGDEVAADTQYIYSKIGGSMFSQSSGRRVLSTLTTWPENWTELMTKWIKGKKSRVYTDYEKATEKKITPDNWFLRRKALGLYFAILSLAYLIERTTRLRAGIYTGWTSLQSIARMIGGQLPGLELPKGAAYLTAGTLTLDKKMIKQGWNIIRPDRVIIIVRELLDIMAGKKDWLQLFLYLEKQKKEKLIKSSLPKIPRPPRF